MVRAWEIVSISIVIGLAVANAACTGGAALSAGSIMVSDKTLVDHAVSTLSGKDCATVRKEAGLTYCKEDEAVAVQPMYCYPTLGDVTCYPNRDPYHGRQRTVDRTVTAAGPLTPRQPGTAASAPASAPAASATALAAAPGP